MRDISKHIERGILQDIQIPTSTHICSTNEHVIYAIKSGHPDKTFHWDHNLFMYYINTVKAIDSHLQRQTP